jgi:hypothetical protein
MSGGVQPGMVCVKMAPRVAAVLALLGTCWDDARAQDTGGVRKLIEFGWDRPTPDVLLNTAVKLENHPFDGVVVKLHIGQMVFLRHAYPASAFTQDQSDLGSFHSTRLTDNFLLMWTTRELDWDWYSDGDWAAAEQNIRAFARMAHSGGFRGILLDTEAYGPSPWDYRQQPHRDQYSVSAYEDQLRKRGGQFMRALLSELPAARVLLTYGPASLALYQANTGNREVWASYGLLLAFLEGAQQELQGGALIIDGNEAAYYYNTPQEFMVAADRLRHDLGAQCSHPRTGTCKAPWGLAQAVYVDWFVPPAGNYDTLGAFLPDPSARLQLLGQDVYWALKTSDEYAWVYSQHTDWWKPLVPAGIGETITDAKQRFVSGNPTSADIEPAVAVAKRGFATRVAIEGRVANGGSGVQGVTMRGLEAACTPTDSTGKYRCVLPGNWSGQLQPVGAGLNFSPSQRAFQNLKTNQHAQDFSQR